VGSKNQSRVFSRAKRHVEIKKAETGRGEKPRKRLNLRTENGRGGVKAQWVLHFVKDHEGLACIGTSHKEGKNRD